MQNYRTQEKTKSTAFGPGSECLKANTAVVVLAGIRFSDPSLHPNT